MKVSIVMVRVTTLMILKGSGDILKEDSLPKVVSERRDCHCIWLNMFGNIIIEMIVLIYRKNSFLNNLRGVMFNGSFTTLP
jgi:hypothetical protein